MKKYLYIHVHSSIIHNSQMVEATRVSTDGWMDKQNVIYLHNGVLFSLTKEGHFDVCYNMDETWGLLLRESSQSQKHNYCMIPLEVPRVTEFLETESRTVVVRGFGGEGRMKSCLMAGVSVM